MLSVSTVLWVIGGMLGCILGLIGAEVVDRWRDYLRSRR